MIFMGVTLTEKEQLLLTSVIIEMACDQKAVTDESILHRVLEMAESHTVCDVAQRELRKAIHKNHTDGDKLYQKGYRNCAEMIQDILKKDNQVKQEN